MFYSYEETVKLLHDEIKKEIFDFEKRGGKAGLKFNNMDIPPSIDVTFEIFDSFVGISIVPALSTIQIYSKTKSQYEEQFVSLAVGVTNAFNEVRKIIKLKTIDF